MTYEFSGEQRALERTDLAVKSPKRISITIPHNAYEHLAQRSNEEGRSMSNLAAFILEATLSKQLDTRRGFQ
mgnify:CR=1 FL=1|jgi:hypothetical protein